MTDNDGFDASSFSEAFLQANANREFISYEFADVIRSLVRAFVADDPAGPLYQASEKMNFVVDLLQRSHDHITWYGLFADAIQNIQENIPEDAYGRQYIRAAQRGTKYLVESSATDNAAGGRASRRFNEFLDAIRWADESRKTRN